jgi:hypothetical protein
VGIEGLDISFPELEGVGVVVVGLTATAIPCIKLKCEKSSE